MMGADTLTHYQGAVPRWLTCHHHPSTEVCSLHHKPPITLISGYWKISSKHSRREYEEWMTPFRQLQAPIVIFSDVYNQKGPCTSLINRSVEQLPVWKRYKGLLTAQQSKDPEIKRVAHSARLYAIWHSKMQLALEVSCANPFQTEYFAWIDIGYFKHTLRSNTLWPTGNKHDIQDFMHNWPDPYRIESALSHKRMLFALINQYTQKEISSAKRGTILTSVRKNGVRVAGTMFAAHRDIIRAFSIEYFTTLERLSSENKFTGIDQPLFSDICLRNVTLCAFVRPVRNCLFWKLHSVGLDFHSQNCASKLFDAYGNHVRRSPPVHAIAETEIVVDVNARRTRIMVTHKDDTLPRVNCQGYVNKTTTYVTRAYGDLEPPMNVIDDTIPKSLMPKRNAFATSDISSCAPPFYTLSQANLCGDSICGGRRRSTCQGRKRGSEKNGRAQPRAGAAAAT